MTILDSLIDSILRLDGDALVLHSGDKPYVVVGSGDGQQGRESRRTAKWSQVELSAAPLHAATIWRMLRQILPAERCGVLQELGAVDYQLDVPGERLALTAVSGGSDEVWVEIRRRHQAPPERSQSAQEETGSQPRATVVPIARVPPQPRPVEGLADPRQTSLDALLAAAAAESAAAVYLVSNAVPMIRSGGRMVPLPKAEAWTTAELEDVLADAAGRAGAAPGEPWAFEVASVGRVRGVAFSDESGTGAVFELPSTAAIAATDAALEPAVRALVSAADGLVLVAGPRASGRSTLLDCIVDLVNRSRADHVITIGSQVRTLHPNRTAFISQRTVTGDGDAFATAVRTALRQGPDVLVLDGCEAPDAALAAIEAARSGRLVFMSFTASSASAAVGRLVAGFATGRQPGVRALLADCLRAVVWQILLDSAAGGRVAAREILLGSPAVLQLIARAADARLPLAIQAGRRSGMKTLEDSLVSLVRSHAATPSEAMRVAGDPASLARALQREGLVRGADDGSSGDSTAAARRH